MKREERIIRRIRTVVDNRRTLVKEVLHSIGENPSNKQIDDFQSWCIRDQWKRYKEERMNNYVIEQNNINDLSLSFPNGKKGEKYERSIQLDMFKYENVWIENLEPTGLSTVIDKEKGTVILSGIPNEATDFEFKLCIKLKGWEVGEPIIERKFRIAFNPDP